MDTITSNATQKVINSSNFRSSAWNSQAEAWDITSDLWESALAVRQEGEEYLTKFKREPDEKYQNRLNQSVFNNKFRETVESMAGTVFRSDPSPTDAPTAISDLFSDIDLCGNSLHRFLMNAFELFLRDGNGYFYADAPPVSEDIIKAAADGKMPTLQDRANDRPYLVFYTASQVINHRYERINGRDVLIQATIEECVLQADGEFGEKEVKRHRVLRPGSVEIRIWNKDSNDFVYDSDHQTGLDHIPLVPISTIGTVPPLLVLALLNVLYYNKVSDFDDWCHTALVPERIYQFATKEDADASTLSTVAPGIGRKMWGEHARAYFLEVKGDGIELASARNKEVADEMAGIGIGMFAPTENAAKSATEIVDSAGKRQSKLARFTHEFENAVEKALYHLAEYLNVIKSSKTVDLNAVDKLNLKLKLDYDRLTFSLDQLQFFGNLVDTGKLSLQTFLEWLPQIADMPEGFSPEEELRRIAAFEALKPKPVVMKAVHSDAAIMTGAAH